MAPEIMQKNVSFFNLFSLSAFLKLYVLWIKKLWQIFSLSILSDLVVLKMIMWTFTAKEHCRHRSKWELFQAFQTSTKPYIISLVQHFADILMNISYIQEIILTLTTFRVGHIILSSHASFIQHYVFVKNSLSL